MLGIVIALVAAVLDLTATALGWDGLRPFTKPLPALILGISVFLGRRRSTRILGIGLLFASAGDLALLSSSDAAFLSGMLGFALMHVCYIFAYRSTGTTGPRDRWTWIVAGAYSAALVGANVLLDPHAGRFAIPLAVYSALLATMAWSAFDLHNRARAGATAVALGGAIFMLSDTTLAFAKFYPDFPLGGRGAELVILITYFAAQLSIASGMLRANATAS